MTSEGPVPPGTIRTLRLLLGTARRRAKARHRRLRELLRQRAPRAGVGSGGLFQLLPLVLSLTINVTAAILVTGLVTAAERVDAERQGRIVAERWFVARAGMLIRITGDPERAARLMQSGIAREARALSVAYGGDRAANGRQLTDAVRSGRAAEFVRTDLATPGMAALGRSGLPAMLGSLALLCWIVMLILQGEATTLDVQRQRHPMWEWLFSHPVPPRAVFLAEMLSPVAANPIYWGAPLMPAILYGGLYGILHGLAAAILVGVPVLIGSACVGKAIETAVILRLGPRQRGTALGLMGWLGTITITLIFVCGTARNGIARGAGTVLGPIAAMPWPWLGLFLGWRPDAASSFRDGVLTCGLASVVISAAAVALAVWAAGRGLSAPVARGDLRPVAAGRRTHWGRHPLFRKEALWFRRDRSALVQVILVPLTMAGLQFFTFHGLFTTARGHWNALCAGGILLGSFFLDAIGPKSLL